jgi:hypothetical protein
MPVDPLERALLIDKMRQLLTDPREKVRSTGRRVLHRTLQLVRLAKGHKWAALAGEGGHHRLAQFHLTDLASKIAMDFASCDPERHARAKSVLEEAYGACMLDRPDWPAR